MPNVNVSEGFLFSHDMKKVVMIRKQRPDYLVGKLVGVGGKIELGEDAETAMRREFWEETGVFVVDWKFVLRYRGDTGQFINVFMAVGDISTVQTITDEEVVVVDVLNLPPETNRTCRWSLPMCLDELLLKGSREIEFI